jgi:predicted Fe-Mo cluster-binding NifX family protein
MPAWTHGLAASLVIVDKDTETIRALDNWEATGAGQGAGIQAARLMAADGVQVVLTSHCSPNAFWALRAADIRVYTGLVEGTVREAVRQFQA